MQKAWVYLFLAGLCEIVWAICLKYSQGFTRPVPTVTIFVFGYASFYLLSEAALSIPIGTAYAVWTGIGAIGAAILGIILFAEPVTWLRLLCILLILSGIGGLRLAAPEEVTQPPPANHLTD